MAQLKLLPAVYTTPVVPARWLGSNVPQIGRAIVVRALLDVGLMESPPGSNRGPSIVAMLQAAGVPDELIKAGKGYWCAAWVGTVWRDCGLSVPVGYASCDAWLEHARPEPSIGAAILYGVQGDAKHIGIVARLEPLLITIEGNRSWGGGTGNDGVCVDIGPVTRKDVLGYVHPLTSGG